MQIDTHHIAVTKTARYCTLGTLSERTEEIWFVIHGFAQLAEKFLMTFEKMDNGKRFFVAPEALNKFYLKAGQPEVGATWMTREDRTIEIGDYTNYLNMLYDSLGVADHKAIITVLGFSQGVATVSRWAYQNERRIDRLVFFAGEPGNELQNPTDLASFTGSKNYFIWGTQDQFISEQKVAAAKSVMSNFEFISFEGRHEINIDTLLQIK
jgi:predicted esterase